MQSVDLAGLRVIITQDLRVEPEGTSKDALLQQVLREQKRGIARGALLWVWNNDDSVILYERAAMQRAGAILTELEQIRTWADVCRLKGRGGIAAAGALEIVWDDWSSGRWGWADDDDNNKLPQEALDRILNIDELLGVIPPNTELSFRNFTDDGEFRYFSPVEPWGMGVPALIIRRYYVQRASFVSTWTDVPAADLPLVERTLHALGWTLAEGDDDDLAGLQP